MNEALHDLFSDAIESLWTGILWGISVSAALVVVYFALRGLTGWAAMLKAVVQ